ncbi:MAG: MOSC domain-containing protein [Ardenticatenaceae bacterium]|nr:MOSC domain-containing protein [Ardenticatenaceae bacterium]
MTTQAHVFQLNMSKGGVPKRPLPTAEINQLGIVGDEQRDTLHHGGPERALSLYSLEHILALQAEGHPIYPGSVGENVTITGLDWGKVVPGVRLCLGAVEIEITSYAVPCRTIRTSFKDEEFGRIGEKQHAGWSRAYARVLQGGKLQIGDAVMLYE